MDDQKLSLAPQEASILIDSPKPAWIRPQLKSLNIFEAQGGITTPSADGFGFS